MKNRLISVLSAERAKDAIASKAKSVHIALTALYQNCQEVGNNDDYARACERVDDLLDFILDRMYESRDDANSSDSDDWRCKLEKIRDSQSAGDNE